jgi:F-type H+-transporting ATPase subunit a
VKTDPIKAIDPAVGLLELVSEISKILSFSFRLLGNLFAGMVLLFVMGYILSVLNIAFFGLELFVGLIQAIVFGLLMLIFMNSATESHHADEEHH